MNLDLENQWIAERLEQLSTAAMKRSLRQRHSARAEGMVLIDGRRLIDFGSNDYLGLASDERIVEAVAATARQRGFGAGASPLVSGHGDCHASLQRAVADWKQTEGALLFSSGFLANLAAITALTEAGDTIYSDAENHASIVDACRLSKARTVVYPSGDTSCLSKLLEEESTNGKKLVVTDTVFSMSGRVAPLAELARLCQRHRAMFVVDEAHSTGVFGKRGSGLCEPVAIHDAVTLHVGTFSKALGSVGGFVAASTDVCEYLVNMARSYIFSTTIPEAVAAGSLAAVEVARHDFSRRKRLLALADRLRGALRDDGWDIGAGETQIVPIRIGDARNAMDYYERLLEAGIFAPPIRPPATPDDRSLLRISVTSEHTNDQIDALCRALKAIRER